MNTFQSLKSSLSSGPSKGTTPGFTSIHPDTSSPPSSQTSSKPKMSSSPLQIKILDAGSHIDQGQRPYQEDRHLILHPSQFPSSNPDQIAYFAVYDGHGGSTVADHARKTLHTKISSSDSFAQGQVDEAIRAALKQEDEELLRETKGKDEGFDARKTGSTVAICLVNLSKGEVTVANVGDSHVVIGEEESGEEVGGHGFGHVSKTTLRGDKGREDTGSYGAFGWDVEENRNRESKEADLGFVQKRLTRAFKPDDPDERARMKKAGGDIIHDQMGTARVGNINMSRALGDLTYKQPLNKETDLQDDSFLRSAVIPKETPSDNFISNEPHLITYPLKARRTIIVVSSDGVSDALPDDQMMQIAGKKWREGYSAERIAKEVVKAAKEKVNSDNVTAVVVLLEKA